MSHEPSLRATLRAAIAAFCAGMLIASPIAAQADGPTAVWGGSIVPQFYFSKNWNSNANSWLTFYWSANGTVYRHSQRSGSGNSTSQGTNECASDQGWLPNGLYTGVDAIQNKTDGLAVVRGSVWNMFAKNCVYGTNRFGLFIHSNGPNNGSWTDNNYYSQGCIKVNQVDRNNMAWWYWQAADFRNQNQDTVQVS
jgi:hypothetical protein